MEMNISKRDISDISTQNGFYLSFIIRVTNKASVRKKRKKEIFMSIIEEGFGNNYLFSGGNDAVDIFQHKRKSFSIP